MIKISMKKESEDCWSVTVDDAFHIDGFPDDREAAVWILEYTKAMVRESRQEVHRAGKREDRRKILGAALLSVPEVQ